MFRTFRSVVSGWIYLVSFVTGGNFIRKARLRACGARVKVSPTAFFKFPEHIEIGDDTFINHLCSVWASERAHIRIGRDVLFGPGVTVVSSNHSTAMGYLIREQPGDDADVTIGNDVWLGAHVVVTPGVSLGDGCVVGAGAVVPHDLPAHSICAGVPARVIGYRGDPKWARTAAMTQ